MDKHYISILKLLPTIIGDEEKPRESYEGFFPSSNRDRSQYYYEVEESDSPTRKQLHFKSLRNMVVEASREIADRMGQRVYSDTDDDNFKKKPYILDRQYQVPHIIELEFLKLSPYGNILESEHFDYIENILYQYLLHYDRIVNFHEEDVFENMHHYRNTGIDSDLYENLSPYIVEIDDEDADFNDIIKQMVMDNYEELSKTKRPTKKVLEFMPLRMYACRNLDELLEIAHTGQSSFGYGGRIDTSLSVDGLSNSLPLLMLYSTIAQVERKSLLPSYRSYHAIFDNYPQTAKGEMKENYTLEEYIDDQSAYNYMNDEREDKPFFYRYGANVERNTSYVGYHDNRMNIFIFPHIMNQIRIAYFQNASKMVVPQSLMRDFRSEPWSHLVQAETILSQRQLDWSDETC